MNKGLKFKLKVEGMEEITRKLEEMEEHLKMAISCADEIAKMEIECEVIVCEKDEPKLIVRE